MNLWNDSTDARCWQRVLVALACALLLPFQAHAVVSFDSILFQDGMVLQRQLPVPIWGHAEPGEAVSVAINGQQKTTSADTDDGRWQITLDPMDAGGPYTLTVAGEDGKAIAVHDVLVGEVWLCSGQSNMLLHPPRKSTRRQYPGVRALKTHGWDDNPSGTAFWFGVQLNQSLGVPIGLLNEAVDGSDIAFWLGRSANKDQDQEVRDFLSERGSWGAHYDALIAPLWPYRIRGAIWWQGEKNISRPRMYAHLLPALIRSWRFDWGIGNFPFFFVQLPTGGGVQADEAVAALPKDPPTKENLFPRMRDAYLMALTEPDTGMVITTDLKGGLHPPHSELFGGRLARLALAYTYGEPLVPSGPVVESCTVEGSRIRFRFLPNTAAGLYALGDGTLQGFSIAGADERYVWATAEIQGSEVVVSSAAVSQPVHARYAWGNAPKWANLYNGDNWAAAPFSTDALAPCTTVTAPGQP